MKAGKERGRALHHPARSAAVEEEEEEEDWEDIRAPAGGNTAAMLSGTVVVWGKKAWGAPSGAQGSFGFVAPADGGDNLFCHRSVIQDCQTLGIGDPVMYVAGWDDMKGKMAITKLVRAVGGAADAVEGEEEE
eukprot:856994-Heterocapsa_arctica.AAC.1